jgi:hypothetical protein
MPGRGCGVRFKPATTAAMRGDHRSRSVEPTMENTKSMHKFELGQSVSLQSILFNRDAAPGA